MKKYKVNDKVICPGFGVVSIKRIEQRGDFEYYVLVTSHNMTIIVNTKNNDIREIVKETSLVYKVLKTMPTDHTIFWNESWNKRYRVLSDKLKSGSIFNVAEVLRDLAHIKKMKDLSFGERKMIDSAKQLFVSEMAIAQNLSENEVETELDRILG